MQNPRPIHPVNLAADRYHSRTKPHNSARGDFATLTGPTRGILAGVVQCAWSGPTGSACPLHGVGTPPITTFLADTSGSSMDPAVTLDNLKVLLTGRQCWDGLFFDWMAGMKSCIVIPDRCVTSFDAEGDNSYLRVNGSHRSVRDPGCMATPRRVAVSQDGRCITPCGQGTEAVPKKLLANEVEVLADELRPQRGVTLQVLQLLSSAFIGTAPLLPVSDDLPGKTPIPPFHS